MQVTVMAFALLSAAALFKVLVFLWQCLFGGLVARIFVPLIEGGTL